MATSTPRYGYPLIDPDDQIRTATRQAKLAEDINRVSVHSDAISARIDAKATNSVTTSENAKQTADAERAKNLLQDLALEAQDLRVRALEALATLDPGEVSDGTVASLVANEESLSHEALAAGFVKRGTLVHDVRDYGAKGDNTTDDSAAFQAAIDAARTSRGRAVASGRFRLDQPILIDANADFGDAVLNYYGQGIAIDVRGYRLQVVTPKELWNRNKTNGEGWDAVAGSVGVRTINTNGCFITVPFVANFETGLLNLGSDGGCAYNIYELGWLFNNKINHHLDTYSSTGVGYTNQNTYIAGRTSHHAAEGEDIPGVVSVQVGGSGDGGPNNNVWLNPCWEGVGAEYTWHFVRGRDNKVYNVRIEYGNRGRFGERAIANEFHIGYESPGFDIVYDEGSVYNNIYRPSSAWIQNQNIRHQTNGADHPWFQTLWGNRSLVLGTGNAEGIPIRARNETDLQFGGTLVPNSSGPHELGTPTTRWHNAALTESLLVGVSVDLEPSEDTPPLNGAVRLVAQTNTAGKLELRALWPNGDTTPLATEP